MDSRQRMPRRWDSQRIVSEGFESGDPPSRVIAEVRDEILSLRWREMEIGMPVKPDTQSALRQAIALRVPPG